MKNCQIANNQQSTINSQQSTVNSQRLAVAWVILAQEKFGDDHNISYI